MMILTRRIQESINIGDDVVVTVLGTVGGKVRIGIDAPRDIPVHREEIYWRVQQENGDDSDPLEEDWPGGTY